MSKTQITQKDDGITRYEVQPTDTIKGAGGKVHKVTNRYSWRQRLDGYQTTYHKIETACYQGIKRRYIVDLDAGKVTCRKCLEAAAQ